MAEQVFLVRRQDLLPREERAPDGFEAGDANVYLERCGRWGFFAPREAVESDPRCKQIIPYGVLIAPGDEEPLVFLMRRTRRGGEERLHDRLSVGVGGHVNPGDLPRDPRFPLEPGPRLARELIDTAFRRELQEELHVETPFQLERIGILNDDASSVGEVHFGIVYAVRLEAARARVREVLELEGDFVPLSSLGALRAEMESWSSHVIDGLWDTSRPRWSSPSTGADAASRESPDEGVPRLQNSRRA